MSGISKKFYFLKACFLLVSVVVLNQTIWAQTSPSEGNCVISGRVIDAIYGDPLPYAHVLIDDVGVYSDKDGIFTIVDIPYGEYKIEVSYVGYHSETIDISCKQGVISGLIIKLSSERVNIEEVFVTASKKKQHISLAAVSTEIVSAKQIAEKNVSTFDQALDGLNGLTVTRSSTSNIQAVSIRGASEVAGGGVGNRVLLLIDGRPAISPDSGGALWNLVPLSSIDRIEVVKGAYSSLYGSSAMGGVIQVITKEPKHEPTTTVHLDYGFYEPLPTESGYGGHKDFYTLALARGGKSGRFSYLFDVSLRSTDGHRQKSKYNLFNTYTKLKYKLSGQRSIQLSANINKIKNDTPATWLSAFRPYEVAEYRTDDYQDREEINIDLHYEAIANRNVKYSTRFYYYQNYSEFSFNDDPQNDSTNINTGTSQIVDIESVLSQRIGNISQVNYFTDSGHHLIGGLDMLYDFTDGVPDTLLYGKHQAANLAAYVQDEVDISDKLTVTLGLRYDYFHIIDEFTESNISPKLSAIYKWHKNLSSRLLISQAYRNPSIAERYIKFEQGGGLRFRPNPDLVSEHLNLSLEVGTRWQIDRLWSMDVALFHNRYQDLISFQRLSAPTENLLYQVINLKKAIMQGLELKVNYHNPSGLSIGAGYTYLDAKDNSPDRINDVLAYKVKHSIHVNINKKWSKFSINLNSRYRSAIQEVFIYPGNEPKAYALLNIRTAYQLTEKQSIYLAIQNLTNTRYEELERYRMPGRSYSVGARVKF